MDVQIAADTAAFSHAVTKARSMNMIVFSNIAKRIYYGYSMLYVAAYMSLLALMAWLTAELAKHTKAGIKWVKICKASIPVGGAACPVAIPKAIDEFLHAIDYAITLVGATIQFIMETIEFLGNNMPRLYATGAPTRAIEEVKALDEHQSYMADIAPWWGWAEAFTRGMRNGATFVGTWPIPPGKYAQIRNYVGHISDAINNYVPGAEEYNPVPPTSYYATDGLPIEKKYRWSPLADMGANTSGTGGFTDELQHVRMCLKTMFSPEFIGMQLYYDHWRTSEGAWKDDFPFHKGLKRFKPQHFVRVTTVAMLPLGCILTRLLHGDAILPYEPSAAAAVPSHIARTSSQYESAQAKWFGDTSNLAMSYRKGEGRMDDDGARSKVSFIEADYTTVDPLYENDGYWAMSKAEIVYDPGLLMNMLDELIGGLPGEASELSPTKFISDIMTQPSMWSPQWTARLRPWKRPGDSSNWRHGIDNLESIFNDVVYTMLMGFPIAYLYDVGNDINSVEDLDVDTFTAGASDFFERLVVDFLYMQRATPSFTGDYFMNEGFEK
jgi:hypothetical protein